MGVLPLTYAYEHDVHAWCPQWAEDSITNGYEPPCGGWEPNPVLLQKSQVLLTAWPSAQPLSRKVFISLSLKGIFI